MSHKELDDLLVMLQSQENEREDEQFAYVLEEKDIAIVEKFKYDLAQYEGEEEMFNALCLEFQRNKSRYATSVLHEIWNASPQIYFARERRRRKDRMDFTEQYWLQKHISLEDPTFENPVLTFNFRDHYRINRSTFEVIVNKLEIQIAVVFWRFSNCHYGYRIAEMTLGVSAGSFRNFTERFLDAMMTISKSIIAWPINDPEKAAIIADGFRNKGRNIRLDQAIGAIDGKNIVIQKPIRRGNDYLIEKVELLST
ncbi:hypothetical protein G6F56_003736 [Rhizopus delemar]|nr:hypothetical protein G6F56_003736 [Rhizopus delemar]